MSVKQYDQPCNQAELLQSLAKMNSKSVIVAGGTDFMVKQRSNPKDYDFLLSLSCMKEMAIIQEMPEENLLSIGAMATHSQIATHPLVKNHFTALAMACDQVGSLQIRNLGTIGGNLANASVAGDMIPVLHLFSAKIQILDKEGQFRILPVEELILSPGRTILEPQEVIWAILIPFTDCNSCFIKLGARKEVSIADISLSMSWKTEEEIYTQVKGILGAIDKKPVELSLIYEDFLGKKFGQEDAPLISNKLKKLISEIRMQRSTASKLRITDVEKKYKERAIKGVVYDLFHCIHEMH